MNEGKDFGQKRVPGEIFRFERDRLLYRLYFLQSKEVRFTVTGDNIRLGILTKEDLAWDFSFDLPAIGETSSIVNVNSHPVWVVRTAIRRLAQYMVKHRPYYFFYIVPEDRRLSLIISRLLRRQDRFSALYCADSGTSEDATARVTFTRILD